MKKILLATTCVLLATVAACGSKAKPTGTTTTTTATVTAGPIDGTWVPVSEEMGGNPFPAEVVAAQKLTVTGNTYHAEAENVDDGELKFDGNKIDMYSKSGANEGKHFTAIYKLENGMLTICYNLAGDSYPTEFESKSKPMLVLAVFKKVDAAAK